ncbi:MAG TPA: CpsD/CapB family tyrosine-protein kinase [Acidobacteriota bacterium]|nr:CpsD/CapB family tyrosine-protein kinase [Acidobacteriota bacterium]
MSHMLDIEAHDDIAYEPIPHLEPTHPQKFLSGLAEFDFHLADPKITSTLDAGTISGEQFRFLRARLSLLQRQQGVKKLLITSSIPEEGKTFVSCCLAGILAQEPGKRVLLMDADLRVPGTAKKMGLEREGEMTGLSQILQHGRTLRESLIKLSGMELYYLPSGEIPQNPSALLASDKLEQVILESGELFDWIVIDAPPVLNVADASHLAPLCDTVLFVIRCNKTPAKLIQKAIETIGKNRICGILMNRINAKRTARYYYKYYYKKSSPTSK